MCATEPRFAALWVFLLVPLAAPAADWTRDFEAQRPSARPRLEARYASAGREGFVIEAEKYTIHLELAETGRHAMGLAMSDGTPLATDGLAELEDAGGTVWSTQFAHSPSRVNLYRRGPYYNEIHWLDLAFGNEAGGVFPVRGEMVFHSYAEPCRIGLVLHATEPVSIRGAALRWTFAPGAERVQVPAGEPFGDCLAAAADGGARMAFFPTTAPRAAFQELGGIGFAANWTPGDNGPLRLTPGNPVRFDAGMAPADDWDALRAELEPLPPEDLIPREGMAFAFDPVRGDYAVSSHNPGGFNYHYYENRNDYRAARVAVRNGEYPRKIYLRHEVGSGSRGQVECGVALDADGELLPILNQISKNFAGEEEEPFYNPGDAAFSETYIPLFLEAGEECELTSLHLYQNWGDHPLKQFSSLGAWMDYFHMSTGVTETTCYVPFKFYTGIAIADLRPMSGRMWDSQPQHDNVGGHIFMEYQAADRPVGRQVAEYVSTSYRSTGPNWAHVVFEYLSSGERVKTTLETFEYPQLDELRNFIRLRIEALEDLPIGDWATDFRIMQIDTRTQSLRYQNITHTDATGAPVTTPIRFDGGWTLRGEPLAPNAPAAALWNSPKGNNAFIVERWGGTLGGRPPRGLAVSCEGRENGDSNLILVPDTDAGGLKKGDVFEVDLFIMPYGKEGDDYAAAPRERERYGLNPVRVGDAAGADVLSHFPPRLRLTGEEPAEFTLRGGYATVGVCIEGLTDYRGCRLQTLSGGEWKTLDPRSAQTAVRVSGEGQQRYVCDDGSFGTVFRVRLDGGELRCRVIPNGGE